MVSRWCKICKVYRQFNIFAVQNEKKTRVVCGYCGTVLLDETEIRTILEQAYTAGCC